MKQLNTELRNTENTIKTNETEIESYNSAIQQTNGSITKMKGSLGNSFTQAGAIIKAGFLPALNLATTGFNFLKDNILEIEKQTQSLRARF